MALAIAIASTGCNPLLGIAPIAPQGDAFADATDCPASGPVDHFIATPACGAWAYRLGGARLELAGGRLVISLENGELGGCFQSGGSDFTAAGVFVQVTQVATQPGASTRLDLSFGEHLLGLHESDGVLAFADESTTFGQVAYLADQMAWWRLWPTTDGVLAEVSPDGATWTPLATAAHMPLSVELQLYALA